MYRTREFLKDRGYERYEISIMPDLEWNAVTISDTGRGVSYLGLGLGASSYVNGCRFCNERDLGIYLGEKPGKRLDQEIPTKKDMEEEFFFTWARDWSRAFP